MLLRIAGESRYLRPARLAEEESMEDMDMEEATWTALHFHQFYAICRHYSVPSLFHHSPRSYFPKFE
jgi:hypothetical protein